MVSAFSISLLKFDLVDVSFEVAVVLIGDDNVEVEYVGN